MKNLEQKLENENVTLKKSMKINTPGITLNKQTMKRALNFINPKIMKNKAVILIGSLTIVVSCNIFSQSPFSPIYLKPESGIKMNAQKDQPSQRLSLIQLIDSVYYWEWDTSNTNLPPIRTEKYINMPYNSNNQLTGYLYQVWKDTVWVNERKISYTYDNNSNRTGSLIETWNGANWMNSSRDTITYDANNNKIKSLYLDWNNTSWINTQQIINTYDANNNLTIEMLYQNWTGSTWGAIGKNISTYDTKNNITRYVSQYWMIDHWENQIEYEYRYDAKNINKTNILKRLWYTTGWENVIQNNYTYDTKNNLTLELSQEWDDSIWVNTIQYTNIYDVNNNMTNKLYQTWNGNTWVNNYQDSFTYDVNNNQTMHLHQDWDGSSWVNTRQYTYTFDSNNFNISYAFKGRLIGSPTSYTDSIHNYFHTITGINNLTEKNANVTVYPNPSDNGKINIVFSEILSQPAQMSITNILGEKLQEQQLTEQKSEITLNYQRGVYLITIISTNEKISKKIILK